MQNKKKTTIIGTFLIVVLVCVLSCSNESTDFDGTRTSTETAFILDFDYLNSTEVHEISLMESDTIDVKITITEGAVDLLARDEEEQEIYRADDASSGEFSLVINHNSSYTFSVCGRKASGYVSFILR